MWRDAVAEPRQCRGAVRGSEDFTAVSAAFKRMKNILAQAKEKGIAGRARGKAQTDGEVNVAQKQAGIRCGG